MTHVLRLLTTPYFLLVDFALDAPVPATALAILGGLASAVALWR